MIIKQYPKSAAHVAQRPKHGITFLLSYAAPGFHIAGASLRSDNRAGIRGYHSYGILTGTQTEGCEHKCRNNDIFHNFDLVWDVKSAAIPD